MAETESPDTPPRVFVSHHSSKADVAHQVEALLAKRGIRCWIAPRDVPPGAPFDSAIQEAIKECAAVLLLFCSNSDKSRHVKRELILGDSAGRPIVPLRLEAIDPGELAYHLADSQWIDWIDRREAVMDRVAAQIRLYAGAPPSLAADVATLGEGLRESSEDEPSSERKWAIPALIGALVLSLGAAAYFALGGSEKAADPPETMASAEPTEQTDEAAAAEPPPDEPTGAVDPTPAPPPPSRATTLTAPPRATPSEAPARAPTQVAVAPVQEGPLRRVVQGCMGAATDTEYLLCAHPDLDAKARELGGVYREIRSRYEAGAGDARAFQTQQRSWLNGVKARCGSKACVESSYDQRTAELRSILAQTPG